MSDEKTELKGPDLSQGVALSTLAEGALLLGHVGAEAVLLARSGDELFAINATCTHYGGPLAEGLLVGDSVRCPWHHACFSLRSGAVLRAPALDPVACWRVEQRDGVAYVREKIEPRQAGATAAPAASQPVDGSGAAGAGNPGVSQSVAASGAEGIGNAAAPATAQSIVIIGGGGAGNAAALMLRQQHYSGAITLLSADAAPPYDRPNLSKGDLAGTGSYSVMPARSAAFYEEQQIDLRLDVRVARIDAAARQIELEGGSRLGYDRLLLATGADPVRLELPGADLPHVHYLRSRADCDALIAAAKGAQHVVVIGASFIGLEVAASLRARELDVQVIGREAVPMQKVLGPQVGAFIRRLHEQHGVRFHLGASPAAIDAAGVTLQGGTRLDADLVVIGVGVGPNLALAQQAGLTIDRGVSVDEYLQTSTPGIYAAGDIARWPDPLSGERIRVEHWVVAERQGQTAARNMLGARERFDAVPFFWTEQYDFGLAYIGHAEHWDEARIDGDLEQRDCRITYSQGGRKQAVAVVHRDFEGLRAEADFERTIATRERAAGREQDRDQRP